MKRYLIHRQLLALSPDGDGTGAGSGAADAAAKAVVDKAAADAAAAAAAATPEAKAAADKVVADKAAADKAAADAKAALKYDLKLPEKSTVDASVLERTAATARALGLPDTTAAQQVVDLVHKEVSDAQAAVVASWEPKTGTAWKARDQEWRTAAIADPLLGGGKQDVFDANVALATRVLAKFGDDQSRDFIERSGLGSNPAALRLLVSIGKAMGEASLVIAPAAGKGPKTDADVAHTLYPSMRQAAS